MKKYNTQKSFIRSSIAALCLVVAFFAYSCKKDAKTGNPKAVLSPPVAQAKSWYESAYPKKSLAGKNVSSLDSSGADFSQLVSPDWNNPAIYSRFEADVIEMPMEAGPILSANLNDEAITQKNSRSWFLLLNELGKYNAYIMTIIADDDYLKGDLDKLNNNEYNKRDSDFSGTVIYTTPIGKLVNGWKYKNGVAISQMSGDDETASVNAAHAKATQALKTNKIVIITTTTCITWTQTSSYTNSAGQTVTNAPVTLSTQCTNSYSYYDDGSGGGGGSGVTTGTTSGGTGGGTSTKPIPPTPCIPRSGSAVQNVKNSGGLSVNDLKVQFVTPPIDGGNGFPPPSGKVPCPTTTSKTITNNITDDPCLRNKVNAAVAKDVIFKLNESMVSIFNSNTNFNLSYFDAPSSFFTSPTVDGVTQVDNSSQQNVNGRIVTTAMDIRITLNHPGLQSASQEYVTATIMHEAFHAYLTYSHTILNQHLDMARNYFSSMATQLRAMYPSLSQADANALTWGGLEKDALSTYSSLPQADKNNITITNKDYKTGKSGTPCP